MNEKSFDPLSLISCCTVNVMASIVFGRRFDKKQRSKLEELFEAIDGWANGKLLEQNLLPFLSRLPQYMKKIAQLTRHNDKVLQVGDDCNRVT